MIRVAHLFLLAKKAEKSGSVQLRVIPQGLALARMLRHLVTR
jgi:hypothetical protein